jgi:DNA-binding NarL/FixJ family response regulator
MIRVLVFDDHPALRAGLRAVLGAEPGFVLAGTAGAAEELLPLVRRARPDVVLLDYHVPGADGLQLCQRLKRELSPPAVVVYSAYADERLQVPALIAGADALVSKSVPARELFEAIRLAARGESAIGPVAPEHVHAAMEAVGPTDAPIIAMLLDRTPPAEIARVLGMDAAAVGRRIERIIGRLRAETPVAAS